MGLTEEEPRPFPSVIELMKSEWSPEFERLMRNRLLFGAYRYRLLADPKRPDYDCVASMIRRLENYKETGNLENLVDVANLCLIEFETGSHPKQHFEAAGDQTVERVGEKDEHYAGAVR